MHREIDWDISYPLSILNREEEAYLCDPKDGELYLIRLKSREILMEDHTGVDVQIALAN